MAKKPIGKTSEQDSEDENVDDTAGVKEAVEALAVCFAKPLESKGVSILALHDEVEEVVRYARKSGCCALPRPSLTALFETIG